MYGTQKDKQVLHITTTLVFYFSLQELRIATHDVVLALSITAVVLVL